MAFTDDLASLILHTLRERSAVENTPAEYASMKYPKLLPIMKFTVNRFRLPGFGSVMVMRTDGMSGALKLMTASFMPFEGVAVPYLLLDCMAMKGKSLAYAEYYNCTGKTLSMPEQEALREKYASLPDYAEKDAWYIRERTPYSLIKGGEGVDPEALARMAAESVTAYLEAASRAERSPDCVPGLERFRERMIVEGNPATPTMKKVLGAAGAERFFKTCVMPLE